MVLASLILAAMFLAQTVTGSASAAPQAAPPQSSAPQVTTGARASEHPIVPFSQLLADHNWIALNNALPNSDDPDAVFYRGLLANRQGKYVESIQILEPLIPAMALGADRNHEKLARMALADDYLRTFQYAKAAAAYAALTQNCAEALTDHDRAEIEVPAKLLPTLHSSPPQTVEFDGSFTTPTERNVLGLMEVSVWVDGYASSWLFDPAEKFTMLSASLAKTIGLKLSNDAVTIHSLTGVDIQVHSTVIPRVKLGRAVFHDVPAVVYQDRDLYDARNDYQIQGVLAQPMLAALGQVTASDDQHLTISSGAPLAEGTPFFSDGDRMIVGLGPRGSEHLYAIDPGTVGSLLTSRYYDEHLDDFAKQKMELLHLPDAPNNLPIPAYTAEVVNLTFGEMPATFHELPVLAQPAGIERDRYYGTLRMDALEQLHSFTFDFRSMRFTVRDQREQ